MNCCCENGEKPLILRIKKGETLGFAFTLTHNQIPIDLTDAEILVQVRDSAVDDGTFVIDKNVTENSDVATEGRINNPTEGQFFIMITSSETENLSTLKPYFIAIYLLKDNVSRCISANSNELAQLIVLNP